MKKLLLFLVILLALALTFVVLKNNKEQIEFETSLGQKKIDIVPVSIESVKDSSLEISRSFPGKIKSEKELMISSMAQGEVVTVLKEVGDPVKKGEMIAKVDDQILQSQYKVAISALDKAKKDLQRFENLSEGKAVTTQQLEGIKLNYESTNAKVEALQEQIENTRIISPINGTINMLLVEKGSLVGPGVPVAEVVGLDHMVMSIKVTENDLDRISQGLKAVITTELAPQQGLNGVVKSVGVKADRTFQYDAELLIEDKGVTLPSGIFARATFDFGNLQGIVIDKTSVLNEGNKSVVYVIENDLARKVYITTGGEAGRKLVVTSGLKSGDKVVVQGQNIIENGTKVRIVD